MTYIFFDTVNILIQNRKKITIEIKKFIVEYVIFKVNFDYKNRFNKSLIYSLES